MKKPIPRSTPKNHTLGDGKKESAGNKWETWPIF